MDRSSDRVVDRVANRRRWIQLCGSVGLAGLAGCLGDDDDTGDTSTGSGDSDDGPGGSETDEDDADEQDDTDGEADEDPDGGTDSGAGERIELAPEDGWKESHEGVEIPEEPGTAILKIGGERVELGMFGNAMESPEGMGTTGAEVFEASGAAQNAQSGSSVQVEFQRLLGFQGSAGTWAESDSITFSRGGVRLGNVIFRQYEDGTLADAEQAGDLEGRTFVDGSFIHVTTEGVVTAVEELVSHEDDSLNGQFEFGARLQNGWDQ